MDKPRVLVVDDNEDILFNLKLILELNGYEPILARDGDEALKIIDSSIIHPDIIISDIMMPNMNGYDFFEKVSNNPLLIDVPFLFLSAKTTPEEIRLGKVLGADEYVTKPFKEEDLLSIIEGKLNRSKKAKSIRNAFEKKMQNSKLKEDLIRLDKKKINDNTIIFIMMWDEIKGPDLINFYPSQESRQNQIIKIDEIGLQLFYSSSAIYGAQGKVQPEGLLIKATNFNVSAYIYFDTIKDPMTRGGDKLFMVAIISPEIGYFDSFFLKKIAVEISSKIKKAQTYELENYWKEIVSLLCKSCKGDF